jgi:hypothetical protein
LEGGMTAGEGDRRERKTGWTSGQKTREGTGWRVRQAATESEGDRRERGAGAVLGRRGRQAEGP